MRDSKKKAKVIKSLKNSSATGVDFIDTKTVKLAAEVLTPALTHIINLSITTNTFPDIWKYAKIIPLLKSFSSDPLLPKSYRPIALLPILSKVLEKIVFTQLRRTTLSTPTYMGQDQDTTLQQL